MAFIAKSCYYGYSLLNLFLTGACLEDKLFPKTNSLHDGRAQPLANKEKFALKIKVQCPPLKKQPPPPPTTKGYPSYQVRLQMH